MNTWTELWDVTAQITLLRTSGRSISVENEGRPSPKKHFLRIYGRITSTANEGRLSPTHIVCVQLGGEIL